MDHTTDVAILGAGIGGYETFRTLTKLFKRYHINKKITIVDQNNYFTFTPMLHEVASGSIEPQHCAIPLRELVYKTPHAFLKATVQHIDPDKKTILTSEGAVFYDYCIVGLGSGVNYFNTLGAEEHCYSVRTLPQAMELHEELFRKLEQTDKKTLTITIVGGGPTGVEVVGQYAHLVNRDTKALYPNKTITLQLIEAGPEILKILPKNVQKKISHHLTKCGVTIFTNSHIQEVTPNEVVLVDGKRLPSDITIWSAGVKNIAEHFLEKNVCEKGSIPTNEFLQSTKYSSLYAVGDIALSFNKGSSNPQPQLGETAHKEGQFIAQHITALLRNKPTKPFFFKSLGTLMAIGEWYGLVIVGPITLFGRIAWWIRRTTYLFFLPGFARRLKIVIDWTFHGLGFHYTMALERKPKKTILP